jgi:hypothetical protein
MVGENPERTPWAVRRSLSAYFSKRLAAEYEGFVRRWPAR